jgi:hypothetical protein
MNMQKMPSDCKYCDMLITKYMSLRDNPASISKFVKERYLLAEEPQTCTTMVDLSIMLFGELSQAIVSQQNCELIAIKLISSEHNEIFFITNLINYMTLYYNKSYNAIELIDHLYLVPKYLNEVHFLFYMENAIKIASDAGRQKITHFVNVPPIGDEAIVMLSICGLIIRDQGMYVLKSPSGAKCKCLLL